MDAGSNPAGANKIWQKEKRGFLKWFLVIMSNQNVNDGIAFIVYLMKEINGVRPEFVLSPFKNAIAMNILHPSGLRNIKGLNIADRRAKKSNKMKWQGQGPGECVLSTIAILAGVKLSEIKEKLSEIIEKSIINRTWTSIHSIERESLANQLIQHYNLKIHITACNLHSINIFGNISDNLDLTGRGQIVFLYGEFKNYGHSIAYENGVIFDPSFEYVSIFGDHNDEWGYFRLSELESVKCPPFGMGIERDVYFNPKPISKVCPKAVIKGKPGRRGTQESLR